jgi:inorganic pyrophosphatase
MASHNFENLPTFDEEAVNVVIETSKGQRAKFKYEPQHGMFRFEKVLPLGQTFPFDFGSLPSTIGGDGDPLDVLLLSEVPVLTGSLVLGKILAVMEGEQVEKGKKQRNDRIIALPLDAKSREPLRPAVHFDEALAKSLTEFFVTYNKLQGKEFDHSAPMERSARWNL